MMVRDHIATSLTIEPDDFDLDPFANRAGCGGPSRLRKRTQPLLDELNDDLAV